MKKLTVLLTLAALLPLAGCVAPYGYYDRYGYYGRGAYDGYGRGYYQDERSDPWAHYSAPREYGYRGYGD